MDKNGLQYNTNLFYLYVFLGKKHVEEIAQLALVFISTTKKIRFSKGVRIALKISVGFHSGT